MSTIQDLFQQAQLSEAAYANFFDNSGNLITTNAGVSTALQNGGMSEVQATEFVKHWRVVSHQPDTSSGFSATLFERLNAEQQPTGQYTLAIRGSSEPVDWVNDFLDVAAGGVGYFQVQSMINYVLRLQAGSNGTTRQVELLTGATAPSLTSTFVSGDGPGIDPSQLTITGHSLGGFLGQVYQRIFGSAGVYTQNALGLFRPDAPIFDQLTSLLGLPTGKFSSGSGENLVVPGEPAQLVGTIHGNPQIPIFTETESETINPIDTAPAHYKEPIVDALALYSLFATIDPSLNTANPADGIAKITAILKSASADPAKSLELTLDALRTLFQQNYQYGHLEYDAVPTLVGDGATARNAYYVNLQSLQTWWKDSPFTALSIKPLAGNGASQIATLALADTAEGMAYRYALYKLNPFVVTGSSALYDGINAHNELRLYSPTSGSGVFTEQYLKDRAALLSWMNKINTEDIQGQTGESGIEVFSLPYLGVPYRFKDESSKIQIDLGGGIDPLTQIALKPRRIHFGSAGDDAFAGGTQADHLYGNAGDDTLTGKGGNDHLEGGAGFDTYLINPGDGYDTLLDTDGSGVIKFGALEAIGSTALDPAKWIHTVGSDTWTDRQNGITYTRRVVNGETQLLVHKGDSNVLVKGWSEGELGIVLSTSTPAVTAPVAGADIYALVGIAAYGTETGDRMIGTGPDAGWNLFHAKGGDDQIHVDGLVADPLALALAEDGVNDQIYSPSLVQNTAYGGAGNDLLLGGREFDRLHGGAGDDVIVGADGGDLLVGDQDTAAADDGDDTLYGGDGDDAIFGGGGADLIFAGTGDDTVIGNAGNDVIIGGLGADTLAGESIYETEPGLPYEDYLDGGEGNDELRGMNGADILLGGAGDDLLVGDDAALDPLMHGADYLDGGEGLDTLIGQGGADILYGGAGNDTLLGDSEETPVANHGDDTLDGGSGDDTLLGYGGDDALHGGDGIDELQGGAGNDVLDGGDGGDVLFGEAGNDTLDGGDGADYLAGGAGDDTYLNVTSLDTVDDTEGNNIIRFDQAAGLAAGNALSVTDGGATLHVALDNGETVTLLNAPFGMNASLEFSNGDSLDLETLVGTTLATRLYLALDDGGGRLYGGASADGLYGGAGSDTLSGASGNDSLYGGDGNDALVGGAGEDRLWGDSGDDVLEGGSRYDGLQGGAGDDTLDGGSGNDTLQGDAGADTYLFGLGSGQDTIYNWDTDALGVNADTILLGAGLTEADIKLSRSSDDLIISINGTADSLRVVGYFYQDGASNSSLENIRFADGTSWDIAAVLAKTLTPTLGNDTLTGYATHDTLTGSDGNDTLYGQAGNDVLDGGGGADNLYGGDGDDILLGRGGNDDYLYGEAGNDVLDGGTGDDYLSGGAGADTYMFGAGSGHDTINNYDADALGTNIDTIQLGAGLTASNITLTRTAADSRRGQKANASGVNLTISLNGSDDCLVVQGYFYQDGASNSSLENIRFDDGTTWDYATTKSKLITPPAGVVVYGTSADEILSGGLGNDTIWGDGGNDTLDGSAGDDELYGELGNDTYIFGRGSGKDMIRDYDETLGNLDTVLLGGDVLPGDVALTRDDWAGNAYLVLSIKGTADELRIGEPFNNFTGLDTPYQIEQIRFADGTTWDVEAVKAMVLAQAPSVENDKLYGYDGADTISGLAGNDEIRGYAGNDTLDGGTGEDHLDGGDGNDLLLGGAQNDYLHGGRGGDVLLGQEGDDDLNGFDGNDTLDGGSGNDTFIGGDGADTYLFGKGSGQDVIWASESADTLLLGEGVLSTDVALIRDGDTLVISLNSTDDSLRVNWYFEQDGNSIYTLGAIKFADGTIWDVAAVKAAVLMGSWESDYLTGFASDDTILGLAGDDYIFAGAGNDTLDGGVGGDQMYGGAGDDVFVVDNESDYVNENADDGVDTVMSSIGWALLPNVENLTLTGSSDINGTGNGLDNRLIGNGAANILDGSSGADYLFGGAGNDTYLFGKGAGQDTINSFDATVGKVDRVLFDSTVVLSDVLVSRFGTNLVLAIKGTTDSLTIQQYLDSGSAGAYAVEEIRFSSGVTWDVATIKTMLPSNRAPVLSEAIPDLTAAQGGVFNYTISSDAFVDPDGDALTLSASMANGSALPSWLTFNSSAGVFSGTPTELGTFGLRITAMDAFNLAVSDIFDITVNVQNLTLVGTAGADRLVGYAGNDMLDGYLGADVLMGGLGNDTYIVDDAGDVVVENAGEGDDTVQSSVTYTLGSHIEKLLLRGNGAINGTGNALDNTLVGNSATNRLDGGAGADTMAGGFGDDVYVIDDLNDVIVENAGEGDDGVELYLSGDYTLGSNIEKSTRFGGGNWRTTGNASSNSLYGGDGNDTLVGLEGNDVLWGGTGADILIGGAGDDVYYVDQLADVVTEQAGAGIDSVYVLGAMAYTLTDNVENGVLTLWGGSLTGNALNNSLTGSWTNDVLNGSGGADTLICLGGDDTYIVDSATDVIIENANEGTDSVQSSVTHTLASNVENLTLTGTAAINGTGNALDNVLTGNSANNTLTGGAGNDRLDGGLGNDTMLGGTGNDTYVVNVSTDIVTENANEGTDTVESSVTLTLANNVENLVLTGTTAINGTGNTLNNVLTGNSANNTLSGGTGADTMIGGAGNDTYVVDNIADIVTENLNEGTDLVQSSVTYTLANNAENLTLTGTTAINGTGNTLDNVLAGNSANNTLTGGAGNDRLDGGTGNDTMLGGAGNDTYVVNIATDIVTENANEGGDTIESSVTLTLGNNVENLTLTGTTAINGTGNALDNVLVGNSANNTLTGGAGNDRLDGGLGNDTMRGGTGNDTYVVNVSTDAITENANEGTDTVETGLTYTLGTNLENLTLTGTSAVNGTGNTANNALKGNSGVNSLSGLAGNDTLDGGAGADTLTGGTGNDTYVLGRGYAADTVVENDTTAGNTDIAQFLSGVAADQIWFQKVGNNLETSIIGTSDKLVVKDWYLGNAYHVEQFKTTDGAKTLLDSNVANLVNAMASFAPPAAGQTTLPTSYQTALAPVIAANWQ